MEWDTSSPTQHTSSQAIQHLTEALAQGKRWVPSLLEAMALWPLSEEVFQDRHYRYLLDGEAFDFFELAERLLAEVDGLVPEDEKRKLLFSGNIPSSTSVEEVRGLLGPQKYSAYLNYWYGVTVEEALLHHVEEEEWKRLRSSGLSKPSNVTDRAYRRIYGLSQEELLAQFRSEKALPPASAMSLSQMKEFTYWLFKYRVKHSDGARLASDTRKGLNYLRKLGARPPLG